MLLLPWPLTSMKCYFDNDTRPRLGRGGTFTEAAPEEVLGRGMEGSAVHNGGRGEGARDAEEGDGCSEQAVRL